MRASISWTGEPHDLAQFRSAAPSAVYGSRVVLSDDTGRRPTTTRMMRKRSTRRRGICVTLMCGHVRHIRRVLPGRVVDPDPPNNHRSATHRSISRSCANCPSRRTLPDRPLTTVRKVSQDGGRGSRDFPSLFVVALIVRFVLFSQAANIYNKYNNELCLL